MILNQSCGLLFNQYIFSPPGWIFSIVLWLSFGAFGQPGNGQFMNYGVKDGLCEAICSGIVQDSRGFYWISTQGGISRFDGTNFKSYYPSEMLGEKQVLDNSRVFFEVSPNRLLVTLGNGQAFILNCISQKFTPVESLKNRYSLNIERIPGNRYLVSSTDTLFVLDGSLKIIESIVPPLKKKHFEIRMQMLDDSRFLVSSTKEFFLFDFKSRKFEPFKPELPQDGLFNTGYEILYVDRYRKRIYFLNFFKGMIETDYQGKVMFHWESGVLQRDLCGLLKQMIPDGNNQHMVWVCGNQGVAHLNLVSRQATVFKHDPLVPFSIASGLVTGLFLDRYQNLWATTYKGISVMNKNSILIDEWDFKTSPDEPFMNMCRISDHELLAVKYGSGVFRLSEKTNRFEPYHEKALHYWFAFRNGDQVINGGRGTVLKVVNLKTNQVKDLNFLKPYFKQSELVCLGFRSTGGAWWFSGNSGGGLVRYDPVSQKAVHFSRDKKSFSGSYFTNWSEAPNGDLWFSSNKTQVVTHWIKASDRFEEIDFAKIFEKQHQSIIQCLAADKKGNIWLGFEGTGLVCYNIQSQKTTFYGKKEGITSNFVYNLVFDDQQRLWVGTKKGLACLGADRKTVQYFGLANGFPSEHFDQSSWFDPKNGMLWIASDNYLLRFFPDNLLKTENRNLQIFLDEFLVSNEKQPLEQDNAYDFRPDQNTVQFTFSTLNPLGKEQIEYSYLLEGSDGKWISLGTHSSVIFPSLPSGIYRFHLRAKIPGTKKWIYLQDPVRFEIATPWFRSWWFKLIVILLSAGIIFLITRIYFQRKIEKQRAILERQRAVQNERDRIAYDMHDDLGSGLTKISYLSKEAIRKAENRAELDRINETSVELVKNMSELIWAMKVENDSLADLMSYLRRYAMEYFETSQIAVQMEADEFEEDRQISGEIRRQVFLIFKEALHNIVKHANTERVFIQIRVNQQLQIRIRDYGLGLKPEAERNRSGNGMKTMQERTRRLKGRMELKNHENGVELFFEIPL
ncbi:two-component regulator propeller domain-containing protein [Fluviicola sp.]|uniref:ligand-binding sensor domain-containing protein n=1 Tax=Fluviicola sp. TaxID=1917219 RepID=UPI0031D98106